MTDACVVQFPHPGTEHKPPEDQDIMQWNTKSHRRKFLKAPGRLLGHDGDLIQTDVVFWGEYEAASRVIQRWPVSGGRPTALHEPLLTVPPDSPKRQNTDPWVFGSRFLYSNCKQLTPSGGPSALQSLPRGSVILFGSQIHRRFCLDTVFVVAKAIPYRARNAAELPVNEAFRTCTIESLAAYEHPTIDVPNARFTLYLGATCGDPVDGMFSFTPARSADDGRLRFARPPYNDARFVNPRSKQSPSGAKAVMPMPEVRQAWDAAVGACRRRNISLAIQIGSPEPL